MPNRFAAQVQEKKGTRTQASEEAARAAMGEGAARERRLNVRVPEPLYNAFQEKVEGEGRTITWVVLQFMRDYISQENP